MSYKCFIGRESTRAYQRDYQISIVQRGGVEVYKNVMVSEVGDLGFLVESETIEAAFTVDVPLLGC